MRAACRCTVCSRRRRAAGLIAAALALAGMRAAAAILGGMGWRVNLTQSEPLGFYRLEPVRPGTPIARGAMVEFCPPAAVTPDRYPFYMTGDCPGGGMPMFKEVAAIPGDRIRVRMASVAVNGVVPPVQLPAHAFGEVALGAPAAPGRRVRAGAWPVLGLRRRGAACACRAELRQPVLGAGPPRGNPARGAVATGRAPARRLSR